MSDEVWMGYLLHHDASYTVVQSPFVLGGQRVFGADSDATTLAVAALLHRLEHDIVSAISVPEGIDASSLSAATGVAVHDGDADEEAPWEVLMSDEAIVVVSQRGATVEIPVFDVEVEVDTNFHAAIKQRGTRNCLRTTSAKAPMSLEHNTTKPPLPACNFTVKPMNKVLCGPLAFLMLWMDTALQVCVCNDAGRS